MILWFTFFLFFNVIGQDVEVTPTPMDEQSGTGNNPTLNAMDVSLKLNMAKLEPIESEKSNNVEMNKLKDENKKLKEQLEEMQRKMKEMEANKQNDDEVP